MSSTTLQIIAAVLQISAIGFVVWAGVAGRSESSKDQAKVADLQIALNGKTIELQKALNDKTNELISDKLASDKDRLLQKYPLGFIVLDSITGGISMHPFIESEYRIFADWMYVEYQLSNNFKMVKITIPNFSIVGKTGSTVLVRKGTIIVELPFENGSSREVKFVAGAPKTTIEILRASEEHPMYVIGFVPE